MAINKEKKQNIVNDLKEKIGKQNAIFFVSISNLKVEELSTLRRSLREKESQLQVAKKTLIDLALKEKGLDLDIKNLEGEVASIFAYNDQVLPAKEIYDFSNKNENLKILGGIFENTFRTKEDVIELAKLPTKNELLAKLVGSVNAPLFGFVNVLQGNIRSLVSILSQIKV